MSYFLRSRAVRSLPCSVKVHVAMKPHAKTPPPPVLSPEVTATHFRLEHVFQMQNLWWNQYQHHKH